MNVHCSSVSCLRVTHSVLPDSALGRTRNRNIDHNITQALVAAWHILHDLVPYRDLGPDHFTNRLGKERQTRRLLAQLAALGLDVTVAQREEVT